MDKPVQGRKHDVFAQRCADADMDPADFQFTISFQVEFSFLNGRKGRGNIVIESFSLICECDAFFIPYKESSAQLFFQLFDRFADGGLADKKFFSGPGNAAASGCRVKYTIIRKMFHGVPPFSLDQESSGSILIYYIGMKK